MKVADGERKEKNEREREKKKKNNGLSSFCVSHEPITWKESLSSRLTT